MRRISVTAAMLASGLVVMACGSSNGGGGTTSTGDGTSTNGASGSASTSNIVKAAKANLGAAYRGTDRGLPASAPKPEPGKKVFVIACSMAAEGCAAPARAAQKAGKAIGWNVTLADGKGDPSQYNAAVRSAISANANAIVLVAIDCAVVKGALQEARRKGVATFGMFGVDCDDKYAGGGQKLLSGQLDFGPYGSFGAFVENAIGKTMADYAIAKTDGKAVAMTLREEDTAVIRHIGDGFEREFKKCSSCKLVTVPFTFQDLLTNKLQAKVQAALTQHPDVDVLQVPYDAAAVGGAAPAVAASGRDKDILLIGNEGLTPNIAQIRSGKGQDVAFGAPATWAGYATIDSLNRIFHKQPLVDEGIGIQAVDKEHNLPSTPAYEGNVDANGQPKQDIVGGYTRIWGVGQ